MWKCSLFLVLFIFSKFAESQRTDHENWDFLLFTQHWPPTVCKIWTEADPTHTCNLPKNDTWTIHGIWPTIMGTIEPSFCNDTWPLDPQEIKPIEASLKQAWIDIESDWTPNEFWAHEWNKHGTCAASIEPFNTQLKYFTKGLDWLQNYNMDSILKQHNIEPSDTKDYNVKDFSQAIKTSIGVEPDIECKNLEGKQYLFELRICFSQTLELIDCSTDNGTVSYVTNCNEGEEIIYPEGYKLLLT